LVPSPALP